MPIKLRLDPTCSVIPKVTSCTIDTKTNKITIVGLVTKDLNPGSLFAFTIFSAGNPPAAMPCGSWEVTTKTFIGGKFYTQDRGESPESFMSLPGVIDNNLDYANKITFATDTLLKFTSKTEHDIPKPGFIRIKIPQECKIVGDPKSSGLQLVSFDATDGTILLGVPDGM